MHENANNMFKKFRPSLSIIKECQKDEVGCFTEKAIYPFKGGDINLVTAQFGARKFIVLADGTSVGFLRNSVIYVDVNGLKNQIKLELTYSNLKLGKILLNFMMTEQQKLNVTQMNGRAVLG